LTLVSGIKIAPARTRLST